MRTEHSFRRRRWRLTLAALLLLAATLPLGVAGAQPTVPGDSAPAAAVTPPGPDAYPRDDREVEVRRGDRTIRTRPLKTVTSPDGREAVADRLIVTFQPGASPAERADAHRQAGLRGAAAARPAAQIGPASFLVDVAGAASLKTAARAYQADPRVRYVGPDWVDRLAETPNDTGFAQQWNMTKIQAPAAWNRTHGHSAIRIAILDSGIDESHPDLAGKVVARRDFLGSSSGTDDVVNHGTHVAGIAAAVTNNALGVAGVGYDSRLLNGKVCDDKGSCSVSAYASGIYWAADNGAHVINLSLGSTSADCNPSVWEDIFDTGTNELRDAISYAWSRNVVIVAAAGNNNNSAPTRPASCPNVLSVASTTSTDARSSLSTFGAWVDVAAPGSGITSLSNTGGTVTFSGTSMAAPHVAGLAALVRLSCGPIGAQAVIDRITGGADAIAGTGASWQFGRINALNAVCFPKPSSLRSGTVTASSIQLLWGDTTPGETGFELRRRPVGGAWTTVTLPANTTSWTHAGLSGGGSYEYQVRAYDAVGPSPWSNLIRESAGYKLSVSTGGQGRLTTTPAGINCGLIYGDCDYVFAPGAAVSLTPWPYISLSAGEEWDFDHWEGACTGTGPCTVTMSAARTVRAVFVRVPGNPNN